jgi:hypothetical protein
LTVADKPLTKDDEQLRMAVQDAIDSVSRLERLLEDIGKENLRNLIELIPQTEHDMRMARIRLQALQPRTRTDPDKTPADPLIQRRSSQFKVKKPTE